MNKNVKTPDEFFDSLGKATQELDGISQSQEPTEPTEPVEPTEPQEPIEPVEPVEPTEPTEPTEPVEPNEPVEPTEPDQPTEPAQEGPIDNWDEPVPTEPDPDVSLYQQLSKDLGVENLTKEQLAEALSPKEDTPITGIPDDLALLVNLAKSGVDYKEYISLKNADYNAYDNKTLVEHSLKDALKGPDGTLTPENEEQIKDYMEDMSDMDLAVQGNQLRNQLNNVREARLAQIEGQSKQIAQDREVALNASLERFNEVAGFKVQPQHKKSIYEKVSSGDAVTELLYDKNGNYDYDKIVKLKFIADNFDKMVNYHRNRAATGQKREMINKTANVNTKVNQTPPAPDAPEKKDGLDLMLDWSKDMNDPTKNRLFNNL
jgi:hypothetical protein